MVTVAVTAVAVTAEVVTVVVRTMCVGVVQVQEEGEGCHLTLWATPSTVLLLSLVHGARSVGGCSWGVVVEGGGGGSMSEIQSAGRGGSRSRQPSSDGRS